MIILAFATVTHKIDLYFCISIASIYSDDIQGIVKSTQ